MTPTASALSRARLWPRAILMPTCRKYVRFADLAAATTGALWPGHPPIWLVSDAGQFTYRDVVLYDHPAWVMVVRGALERLLQDGRLAPEDWVLLVLEDHAPRREVPAAAIAEALAIADARGAVYMRMNRGWRSAGSWLGHVDGHALTVVDPLWRYYHSLHPAAWRVDHLRRVLDRAVAAGVLDPWSFEKIPYDGREHLVLDRAWPSPFGGFMVQGRVSLRTALTFTHPASRRLKQALLATWLNDKLLETPRALLGPFGRLSKVLRSLRGG